MVSVYYYFDYKSKFEYKVVLLETLNYFYMRRFKNKKKYTYFIENIKIY